MLRYVCCLGLSLATACSFSPTAGENLGELPGSGPDADVDDDPIGTHTPGMPDIECSPTSWETSFASSPNEDGNGDGLPDFSLRSGVPFDMRQVGRDGMWHAPNGEPLDTYPANPFVGVTNATVRMRVGDFSVAQFWINLDYADDMRSPVIATLEPWFDGGMRARFVTKSRDDDWNVQATVYLPERRLTQFTINADASTDLVTVAIDGVRFGPFDLTPFATTQDERWATMFALGRDAFFDFARIETCLVQ